ncbi:MAG: hypothetical protein ACO3GP_04615 [Candidatus Limnocylindrus sp.]
MSQVAFDPLTGTLISTTTQVAQLDSSGQISGAVIPAEYDDVQAFPTLEDFPNPGVVARIYFPQDTNIPHRWDTETLSYIPIASDADGGEF